MDAPRPLPSADDTAAQLLAAYFDPSAHAVDTARELGMSLAQYSKTLQSPDVAVRLDFYEHLHTRLRGRCRQGSATAMEEAASLQQSRLREQSGTAPHPPDLANPLPL